MLRILVFIILLMPSAAWSSEPVVFNMEETVLILEQTTPVILEVRQGGKTLLNQVLAADSHEVSLDGLIREGEFQVRILPAVWEKGESTCRQGTGLGDLLDPRGIAVDVTGRVIIADTGNDRVQVFSSELNPRFEFGGFHWAERDISSNSITDGARGRFNVPLDVAATMKDIFVADRENHRVQKFDLDGNFLLSFGGWGDSRGRLGDPAGLATDRLGNVYVADSRNDRVQKFDINGNFVLEIGGFGSTPGRLNAPVDVAVDQQEKIYILDNGNHRVQIFDRYGHTQTEWLLPANLRYDSLAVYGDAIVAVSVPARGEIFLLAGPDVTLNSLKGFKSPRGIVYTESGTLLVVEGGRSRLTRCDPLHKSLSYGFSFKE